MIIAAAYQDGSIFEHLEHCPFFMVYHVSNGEIQSSHLESCTHSLLSFLLQQHVDALLCNRLSPAMQQELAANHIAVYRGIEGDCEGAVQALMYGQLGFSKENENE